MDIKIMVFCLCAVGGISLAIFMLLFYLVIPYRDSYFNPVSYYVSRICAVILIIISITAFGIAVTPAKNIIYNEIQEISRR